MLVRSSLARNVWQLHCSLFPTSSVSSVSSPSFFRERSPANLFPLVANEISTYILARALHITLALWLQPISGPQFMALCAMQPNGIAYSDSLTRWQSVENIIPAYIHLHLHCMKADSDSMRLQFMCAVAQNCRLHIQSAKRVRGWNGIFKELILYRDMEYGE